MGNQTSQPHGLPVMVDSTPVDTDRIVTRVEGDMVVVSEEERDSVAVLASRFSKGTHVLHEIQGSRFGTDTYSRKMETKRPVNAAVDLRPPVKPRQDRGTVRSVVAKIDRADGWE